MSYNRWALALFCAATVWLCSFLRPRPTSDLVDGVILGAVFSVLALTKITFAPAFLVLASLLVLDRAFTRRQVLTAVVLTCATLLVVELTTHGLVAYLHNLYVMSGVRGWRWSTVVRVYDTSRTELLLWLIPAVVLSLCLLGTRRAVLGRIWVGMVTCVALSFFLAAQNAAQHKLVVPLFATIGVASVLWHERTPITKRALPALLIAVAAIAPLHLLITDLLADSFTAAIRRTPDQYQRDLAELHPGLAGLVVSERADTRADPETLQTLADASFQSADGYRETLASLGRDRPQPLSVLEQFDMVAALQAVISNHCESGDRLSAIAWVDPTPLLAGERHGLGRSILYAHWGDSIDAYRRPEDDWLFSRTDCVLVPKIFFNRYDYDLITFYRPRVAATYDLVGEDAYWQAFRRGSP